MDYFGVGAGFGGGFGEVPFLRERVGLVRAGGWGVEGKTDDDVFEACADAEVDGSAAAAA